MIDLRDVEKSFKTGGGRTWVLRRIKLDIAEGEFVTVMGPSGAGKSTLLAILGMLDADWPGEYHLLDHQVHTASAQGPGRAEQEVRRLRLPAVPPAGRPHRGREPGHPAVLPGRARRPSARRCVADTLDRFQIVGKKDLYPSQLSGGQQQLVAVARAVIAKPEAAAGRRADRQPALLAGRGDHGAVQELNRQGTTIVQVTHSEKNAAHGKRIVHLKDGWLE